jgi:hypothetical protein
MTNETNGHLGCRKNDDESSTLVDATSADTNITSDATETDNGAQSTLPASLPTMLHHQDRSSSHVESQVIDPPHRQKSRWAHAVNSIDKLNAALQDEDIDSIEADVLMSAQRPNTPILAHPPGRESDLSLEMMLQAVTASVSFLENDSTANEREQTRQKTSAATPFSSDDNNHLASCQARTLQRHLKLDFKEMDVVVLSLRLVRECHITNPLNKILILNADILSGPGRRDADPSMVPADDFIKTCLEYICNEEKRENANMKFALSLGYKCDWTNQVGYTVDDAAAMGEVVEKYRLWTVKNLRVVLALNARLLCLSLSAFDNLLKQFPKASILAWTGSGEPAIPLAEVKEISSYYAMKGMEERIEFDCLITNEQK